MAVKSVLAMTFPNNCLTSSKASATTRAPITPWRSGTTQLGTDVYINVNTAVFRIIGSTAIRFELTATPVRSGRENRYRVMASPTPVSTGPSDRIAQYIRTLWNPCLGSLMRQIWLNDLSMVYIIRKAVTAITPRLGRDRRLA